MNGTIITIILITDTLMIEFYSIIVINVIDIEIRNYSYDVMTVIFFFLLLLLSCNIVIKLGINE